MDSRNISYANTSGASQEENSGISSLNFGVDYGLGSWTPFLNFEKFNIAQPTDSTSIPPLTAVTANSSSSMFDQNGQLISFGTYCDHFGSTYRPYFAVVQHSATILTGVGAASETRSEMMIKAGMAGKF